MTNLPVNRSQWLALAGMDLTMMPYKDVALAPAA